MSSSERYCPTCGASNGTEDEVCFACGRSLKITAKLPSEQPTHEQLLQQRYRLLERVGEGGFSTVYKAHDERTRQQVAIKALSLRGLTAQQKIEATDAFNREVHWLTGLSHRHLPRIYNHFSDTECWYLVMDFIDGTTLERQLERRASSLFSLEEVLDLGLLLCDVLEYLHTRQPPIIFRDLKPANIMLTRDGHLFLIDFGIARQFKPGKPRDTIPFGSPGYAAPEQYGRAQTTPLSDIYSLGVILHQLLTGHDPSHSPFAFDSIARERPELAPLEKCVLQMVEMNASQRPQSIVEIKRELQRIVQERKGVRSYWGQGSGYSPSFPLPQAPLWPPVPTYSGGGTVGVGGTASAMSAMAGQVQMPHPPQSPPYLYKRNHYAIASLIMGLLDFVVPPVLCLFLFTVLIHPAFDFSWLALFVLLLPSILAVVFGHIGKRRARTVAGMQSSSGTAIAGMSIGYTLGIVYLLLIMFMFSVFHFIHFMR